MTVARIEGMKELLENLKQFDTKVQRTIAEKSMRSGAKLLVRAIRDAAPVGNYAEKDKKPGKLKKAIAFFRSKPTPGFINGKIAIKGKARKAAGGTDEDNPRAYAHIIEFGSKTVTPHSFLRAGLFAAYSTAIEEMARRMKEEIETQGNAK